MATNNQGTKGGQVPTPYRDATSYFKASPQATKQLQTVLQKSGYAPGKIDGIYGKRTEAALQKALAAGYTLSNGVLTKPKAEYTPSDHTAKTPAPLATPESYAIPMNPTTSSNTRDLQQQLLEAGYYLGTSGRNRNGVDGIWGKNSQAALNKALSEGYVIKGNTLVKVALAPKKTSEPESTPAGTTPSKSTWTPKLTAGENCGTEGCAQYANDTLRAMKDAKGRPLYNWNTISGDAWTRMSSPGVKMVYSGYESADYDRDNYSNSASDKRNFAAADKFRREFDSSTLDPSKNYIVNMFTRDSSYRDDAWAGGKDGITGTHTGNLYFDQKTGRWRVSHNIHGVIHDDDFISLQGSRSAHGITAIAEAVPIDYSEQDRREAYRKKHPINGWVKDKLGWWKSGGRLIPKSQRGSALNPVQQRLTHSALTPEPTGTNSPKELEKRKLMQEAQALAPESTVIEPISVTGINPNAYDITPAGKNYIRALNQDRNYFMQKYGLSDEEYADYAKTAVNIARTESNFGDSPRLTLKNLTPDAVLKASKVFNAGLESDSYLKFAHPVFGPFIAGLRANPDTSLSRGFTQIKYESDIKNPKLRRMYNDLGVNDDNLQNDVRAMARGTVGRLIFNDQALETPRTFTDGSVIPQEVARYMYWNAGRLTSGKNAPLHQAEPESFSSKARVYMNNRLIK